MAVAKVLAPYLLSELSKIVVDFLYASPAEALVAGDEDEFKSTVFTLQTYIDCFEELTWRGELNWLKFAFDFSSNVPIRWRAFVIGVVLIVAAKVGNLEIVKWALPICCEIAPSDKIHPTDQHDFCFRFKRCALLKALHFEHKEIVEFMIDIDSRRKGATNWFKKIWMQLTAATGCGCGGGFFSISELQCIHHDVYNYVMKQEFRDMIHLEIMKRIRRPWSI